MFLRNRRFRVIQVHKVDCGVDRLGKVMCIGNRNIERVAHDVDRPCRHGEVDVGVSAVDSQRLMGFDENQPFDEIGKMLLDAPRAAAIRSRCSSVGTKPRISLNKDLAALVMEN